MSRPRNFEEDHLTRESNTGGAFNPKKRKLLNRGTDESESQMHYEEDFDDGYDSDFLGDEEDRRNLANLDECEREEIILQRYEKRQKLLAKKERLKKQGMLTSRKAEMVKMEDEDEPKKKKPKAFYAKDAVYDYSEVKPMLDKMKREREEIERKRIEAKELREKNKSADKVGMDASIADYKRMAEEEEDSTYVDPSTGGSQPRRGVRPAPSKKRRGPYIPSIDDIARIMISRSAIEHWLYEPYLSKILTGSFVKMLVGIHDEQKIYRLVEIINLEPMDTIYSLGDRETNVLAEVRLANDTMKETLEKISNQPLTLEEYEFWVREMKYNHCKFPILGFISDRAALLQACADGSYEYTHEERQELIEREKRFRVYTIHDSINVLVKARFELQHRLENHHNGSIIMSPEDLEADQQKHEHLNRLISEKRKSKKEQKLIEFERLRASQTPEERQKLKIQEQLKRVSQELSQKKSNDAINNQKKKKKNTADPFSRLAHNYTEISTKVALSPSDSDEEEDHHPQKDAVAEDEHDFDLDLDI